MVHESHTIEARCLKIVYQTFLLGMFKQQQANVKWTILFYFLWFANQPQRLDPSKTSTTHYNNIMIKQYNLYHTDASILDLT